MSESEKLRRFTLTAPELQLLINAINNHTIKGETVFDYGKMYNYIIIATTKMNESGVPKVEIIMPDSMFIFFKPMFITTPLVGVDADAFISMRNKVLIAKEFIAEPVELPKTTPTKPLTEGKTRAGVPKQPTSRKSPKKPPPAPR